MLRIGYKPAFLRKLKKLPIALQNEARGRIAMFAVSPENPLLRTHKLTGPLRKKWSFSVDYKHRIVFNYENKHTAVLLDIGDHGVYE